jgi:hypothetical protein
MRKLGRALKILIQKARCHAEALEALAGRGPVSHNLNACAVIWEFFKAYKVIN